MIIKIKNFLSENINLFILVLGVIIFSYPVFITFFKYLPGHLGDGRLINYFLEHGYLFLHQNKLHTSLFDMPFYFPNTNTLSYSDMMLGGMILYIPIREIIKDPQNALLVWFFITCILNYYSMYFLLKKVFKFNEIPSSIGALIFAFSSPRQNQIIHLQYMTQFYMILCFICFFSININKSKIYNNFCCLGGIIFFNLQIYSSFYLGWYMLYGFLIGLFIFILFRNLRIQLIDFIKAFYKEIILYSILLIILLTPLIKHYIAVGSQFIFDKNNIVSLFGFLSSNSFFDKKIYDFSYLFIGENRENFQNIVGIGFFTTIIFLIGLLYKNSYKKYLIFFIMFSLLFFTDENLYKVLYTYFPGATAIRCSPRIIFLLLPVFSYIIANFFEKVRINKYFLSFIILIILCEMVYKEPFYYWTRSAHISDLKEYNIPKNCKIIYYDFKVNEDYDIYLGDYNMGVMWKSIYTGTYTINGYTGYEPILNYAAATRNCIINKQL